jgi:hypothetical protein
MQIWKTGGIIYTQTPTKEQNMYRELSPLEERVITAMVFPMGLLVTAEVSDLVRRDAEISNAPVIVQQMDQIVAERKRIDQGLLLVAQINEMTLGISA